jgi:imidazolonepropionase-like amidohydrolase
MLSTSRPGISHSAGLAAIVILGLALALSGLTSSLPAQTTPSFGIRDKTPELKAFQNARIVVSPQVTIDSAVMIVDNGHVVAVGRNLPLPAGAVVTDLKGRTVYPGFIDPFTDYGVAKTERRPWTDPELPGGSQYLGDRSGGNAWNDAIHAERNCVAEFKPDRKEAKEYLKTGITVVQSVRKDGIFRGRGFVTTLGNGLPNDLLLRPYSWHFLSFDKGSSRQEYPGSLMGSIALIRQTLYDVDWYRKAHEAIRLNPNQEVPEFNAAIEALSSLRGERAIFQPGDQLSLLRADKLSREFGIPFVEIGSGREYTWIKDIAATGATLILPVDFPEAPKVETADDELDVDLATLRHWETAPANPKIVAENKITFAFTTAGLEDKANFLKNIRSAIKRGLDKRVALSALTVVPAQICGVADQAGTLERGKLANFIVCEGDLLEKDAKIYSVWVAGREEELAEIPSVDVRGNYDVSLDDQILQLVLKGDIDKPQGELKIGGKSAELTNATLQNDNLSFACSLDTLAYRGVVRFSAKKTGTGLSGDCTIPDGSLRRWDAKLTAPFVEKPDSAKPAKEEEPLVARLTYPNEFYGIAEPPKSENVLIRNATVWTSEPEGNLENADVLVVNGKFAGVGHNLAVPSNVRVIDGTGKQVTAGIIDAHAHIAASGDVNEGTFSITPEVRLSDIIDPEDINIYLETTGGVTMSHIMHGSANPIGGQCAVIKHKWGSPAADLIYPLAKPTIKFALGENVKQSNFGDRFAIRYPQTRMGVETIMKDEFQTAREYEREWKKYNTLSSSERQKTIPPRKDLGLEEIVDVLNSRVLVHCHGYVASEMLMMMRLAEQYDFRINTFVHVSEGYKIAAEMAKHGAMGGGFVDWWAYKFEVYDGTAYNPALITEKGATFGINSDSPEMARRLNQEAGKTILYGDVKPEEAIKMITINNARQLGVEQYVGSIKVGKDADFVIWNGNPLSTLSLVEQTWIDGRKYFDREDDRKIRESNRLEKAALIQKVLKGGEGKKEDGPPGKHKWPLEVSHGGTDTWDRRDGQ